MIRYILMWVAFIAMLVVNGLANTMKLNGQTTGEVSNKIDVLITPPGYVFSIWGIIYLLLFVWLIAWWKWGSEHKRASSISILFILTCIFNISWLLSWHYEQFVLSIVFMIALLLTLIFLYRQYSIFQQSFSQRFPFSYYLGWITLATIVNISFVLKYYEVSLGINEVIGTLILLAVAVAIGYLAVQISHDIYFVIVIVWAMCGIATDTADQVLKVGTFVLVAILIIAAIYRWMLNKKTIKGL